VHRCGVRRWVKDTSENVDENPFPAQATLAGWAQSSNVDFPERHRRVRGLCSSGREFDLKECAYEYKA
jgi:hypothetical protein